jgi:hypothetical protein
MKRGKEGREKAEKRGGRKKRRRRRSTKEKIKRFQQEAGGKARQGEACEVR